MHLILDNPKILLVKISNHKIVVHEIWERVKLIFTSNILEHFLHLSYLGQKQLYGRTGLRISEQKTKDNRAADRWKKYRATLLKHEWNIASSKLILPRIIVSTSVGPEDEVEIRIRKAKRFIYEAANTLDVMEDEDQIGDSWIEHPINGSETWIVTAYLTNKIQTTVPTGYSWECAGRKLCRT